MVKNDFKDYQFPVTVISVSVIISLVLLLFIGRPLWNGMQAKRKELNAKKQTLKALEVKLENLKFLASREEELKKKNAKVLAALPEDKDVSRLFVQFEKIAVSNGLTVKKVSESTANLGETGVIRKLGYEVTGDSRSYLNLRSGIEKFQSALRILSITGFEASKAGEANSLMGIKFNIETFARGAK